MKWSTQQLSRYQFEPLEFETIYNYDEYVKDYSDIIRMSEIKVSGSVQAIGDIRYRFTLHIVGTMFLEDAWTLEEVPFDIDFDVEEIFSRDETNEDDRFIDKNTIDLYDIVWEDIILEKPIRIVKPNC